MKNLCLALAFMLVGTFAFAGNSVENNIKTNEVNNVQTTIEEDVDGSVEVTLSCGISGTLSWVGDASTEDIIDAVLYFDDLLC